MEAQKEAFALKYIEIAQDRFERFRQDLSTDKDQAAATHAFESCFRLAWALMQRVLHYHGLQCYSPRETFRKAAKDGLINDPEVWFEFLNRRNLSAHTYGISDQDSLIAIFDQFSIELARLISNVEQLK